MLERCGICSGRQRASSSSTHSQTDVPGSSLSLIPMSIHSKTDRMREPHIRQDTVSLCFVFPMPTQGRPFYFIKKKNASLRCCCWYSPRAVAGNPRQVVAQSTDGGSRYHRTVWKRFKWCALRGKHGPNKDQPSSKNTGLDVA